MQGNGEGKEDQSVVLEKKLGQNKKRKGDMVHIGLRLIALGTSIAASSLTFTSSQTTLVYGVPMDAKYSYTSAFKFFAFANAIASVFALLSLSTAVMLWRKGNPFEAPNRNFFIFLHDLGITCLQLAGCSAATAVGYVGQYGNNHAGWVPICDHFQSFCHRITFAVVLGYFSLFAFLFITILSATKYSITSHHST